MSKNISQNVNELFAALSKVQGKLESATKDKSGFNNNYKYADLSQYINISRELLAEHGICVMQMPGPIEVIEVTKEIYDKKNQSYNFETVKVPKQKVTTWIGHESGQFISNTMEIIVEKMTANSWGQSTGSSISFARRYSLAGSLGMIQEDNDNQYSTKDVDKQYYVTSSESKRNYITKLADTKVSYLKILLADDVERLPKILKWAGVSKLEDMSESFYLEAIKILEDEKESTSISSKGKSDFITEEQCNFMKKLVTPARLQQILREYKLSRLGDMTTQDYYKEYDKLRLETTLTKELDEPIKEIA